MESIATGAASTAAQRHASLFGTTDIAGGIPSKFRPLASKGPVYFEGKLVLALSFQGEKEDPDEIAEAVLASEENDNRVISCLGLWDDLNDAWFYGRPNQGVFVERRKTGDTAFVDGAPVYRGAIDNSREVTLIPGWNSACTAINNRARLRWKSFPREA